MRYTYSRWDGSEAVEGVDPDEVIDALSDELLADGDLESALERISRWGMQREGQDDVPGINGLVQQLRDQRQLELERYDLDSVMRDLAERVQEVVSVEQQAIDERLNDLREGGDSSSSSFGGMLERIAARKQSFLDGLPSEASSAMAALADYEFMDDGAKARFQALTEMLERHLLQRHFHSIERSLGGLQGGGLQDFKHMLHDLQTLLNNHLRGDSTGFDSFMLEHGDHFPGASSVQSLVEQLQEQASHTEALLSSMSPQMRKSLDELLAPVVRDAEAREALAGIAEAVQQIATSQPRPREYPFLGEERLTLEEALRLMRRMHDLDALERELRDALQMGDASALDASQVAAIMGEGAGRVVDRLQGLTQELEEAGYVERRGDRLELTARGIRRIGSRALRDIFLNLKRDAFGQHAIKSRGNGGDRSEETKHFEFGDPFVLDLSRTLMNAAARPGRAGQLRLEVSDFEVFHTEHLTQAATVLMLDMSRSMPLRGCFAAAKKVALALNSLIRTQYPRDDLYIIGFSDYARILKPETLHRANWSDYVYGTNMQHGFLLARRLLGRHKGGSRQIILITDGEPTAHFEGDRVQFAYPPTFKTFQETLREVKRCTQEGITINTFMLERSHYLADFVSQMTQINRGRAFFATPERLGDYVLVDYMNGKSALTQRR